MASVFKIILVEEQMKNKYSGFVSNVYVLINTVASLLWALFLSVMVMAIHSWRMALVFFPIACVLYILAHYFPAPIPYKAVDLTDTGIRCGKRFVKYSEITTVNIVNGNLSERYGFPFIENSLGVNQHNEICLEDMICINGEPKGLNGRAAKNSVYVPLNRKTDAILREESRVYRTAADRRLKEGRQMPRLTDGISRSLVVRAAVTSLLWGAMLVLLGGNGFFKIYECILIFVIFMILMVVEVFKNQFALLIQKMNF